MKKSTWYVIGGVVVLGAGVWLFWPKPAHAAAGGGGARRKKPVIDRQLDDIANPDKPDERTYTVQRFDTLDDIAHTFGTTYQEIAVLNGLKDPNTIDVNQVLKIPPAAS